MLWTCRVCQAAYAVGAPRCPQCGSTDRIEPGGTVPKITAHGGPTIAGQAQDGGEESSPGSSSQTSSERTESGEKSSGRGHRSRARTTGSRSKQHQEADSTAASTDGDGQKTPSSDT